MRQKYKRYIVFMYDDYYPDGGMKDAVGDFDSMEEVKPCLIKENEEWSRDNVCIFDRIEGLVVYEGEFHEVLLKMNQKTSD